MSKNTTNENDSQWAAVLDELSRSIGKAAFNTHFLGSTARFDAGRVIVSLSPSGNVDQVEARLSGVVKRVAKSVYGRELDIEFRKDKAEPFYFSEPQLNYKPEKVEVTGKGAYHDQRNAIIQSDKVEVFTQYFRLEWRPLLGPTLSELIRELRQRCYNKDRRNDLAMANL